MAATTTTSAAFAAALLCAAFLAAGAGAGGHHRQPKQFDGDLVSQTCANATSDFCRLRLTKAYCVAALRSDERSAAAKDPRDLALVAVDLVGKAAAGASAKIDAALRAGAGGPAKGDGDAERDLRYCLVDYAVVARVVPECRRLVEQHEGAGGGRRQNPFFHFECVRKLVDAAYGCVDAMMLRKEVADAVAGNEIDEVHQRATLAKAIVEQMLGEDDDWPEHY
ncbi:hypothetical protein ACP70R_042141 [Stipagrostis hirtigluma subsp. patula]